MKEPVLYRDMFPYSSVPRVVLEDRLIQTNIPKDIWITDTTFRDGQQSRPPYTPKQIADIFDFMHRMSGPNGVIRQTEFFLYSEKDREAVRLCKERGYRFPEITGWIRANKNDFKLVKEMGLKETGILTSCSDYHIFLKLNMSRKEALKQYLDIVATALEQGIMPRCHLEDITRADFYGFVIPFVQELMKLSEQAKIPVKVRACDTMGYGFPFPGTALPRGVPEIFYALIHDGGVPSEQLEWHGHNDFHKGLVNGTAAWMYGCSAVNGALLGFGERTGNTPVEAMLIDYISLTGDDDGHRHHGDHRDGRVLPQGDGLPHPHQLSLRRVRVQLHERRHPCRRHDEERGDLQHLRHDQDPEAPHGRDHHGQVGHRGHRPLGEQPPRARRGQEDRQAPSGPRQDEQVGHGAVRAGQDHEHLARRAAGEGQEVSARVLRLRPGPAQEKGAEVARHIVEEFVERPEIRTMDPAKQEPVMEKLQKEDPYIQFAYVVNAEGKKITKNITDIENKAKYETSGLGDNFSDRPWFINPMKDGKSFVSDFYTSKITGALCITVSAPIADDESRSSACSAWTSGSRIWCGRSSIMNRSAARHTKKRRCS